MTRIIFTLLTSALFFSCNVEPKPIEYGNDHCNYCDMTVVDKSHAAQYTTKKGKSFPFDAVECLVGKINEQKHEATMGYILVADFANPGNLSNAKEATYLVSEKIQSPMGANLSAFSSREEAEKTQQEFGGELFSWNEIKAKLKK